MMGVASQTKSLVSATSENNTSNLVFKEPIVIEQPLSVDSEITNSLEESPSVKTGDKQTPMAVPTEDAPEKEEHMEPTRIRYRIHYKNDYGSVVEKSPYRLSKPNITPDPEEYSDGEDDCEEEEDPSIQPVFDIISHVIVRDVVSIESIDTEYAAANAAADAASDVVPDTASDTAADTAADTTSDTAADDSAEVAAGATTSGALTWRSRSSRKTFKIRSVGTSEMVIHSKPIIEALRAVVTYYPDIYLKGDAVTVAEPYYMLLHHQKELDDYFSHEGGNNDHPSKSPKSMDKAPVEGEETQGYHDYKVLRAFLDPMWKRKIDREISRYQETPAMATYEMLWRLFKPGKRVICDMAGYIVRAISYDNPEDYIPGLKVSLWSLNTDGFKVDRTAFNVFISPYEGKKEITTLPLYPVEIVEDDFTINLNPEMEKKIIERGRRCWEILGVSLKKGLIEIKYNGPADYQKIEPYHGRAIVDTETYFTERGDFDGHDRPDFMDDEDGETPEDCYWTDEPVGSKQRVRFASYKNIGMIEDKDYALDDGHYFLLCRSMGGFTLKNRKFAWLYVEHMELVQKSDAYKNLRIPEERLSMIRALTEKVDGAEDRGWSADNIEGKGEGQIFLLHGPSGVGKTYTAECIAEMTGRPLLSLTCADLGTNETQMEGELARWFSFSEKWRAILLLDEADVYFEKRGSGQLQRNSLVSAFLRSMEYYHGILFLTTNRLGHIDDAILSRIHLIIEYQELDDDTRVKIWNQFFAKLRREQKDFMVDRYLESYIEHDPELKALQWNGREIRNAFQTAVALAEHEARTADPPQKDVLVKQKHLQQIVNMSAAFKQYMKNFKGDEARRAYLDGSRMDERVRQYAKKKKEQLDKARQLTRRAD